MLKSLLFSDGDSDGLSSSSSLRSSSQRDERLSNAGALREEALLSALCDILWQVRWWSLREYSSAFSCLFLSILCLFDFQTHYCESTRRVDIVPVIGVS